MFLTFEVQTLDKQSHTVKIHRLHAKCVVSISQWNGRDRFDQNFIRI